MQFSHAFRVMGILINKAGWVATQDTHNPLFQMMNVIGENIRLV